MDYFSVFTGVGGFEIGLQNVYLPKTTRKKSGRTKDDSADHLKESMGTQQFACVGFSELDKHASAVLKYHYPSIKNYGDIQKIDWDTVPDFNLLVGGSPCQDLSVAGKGAGITGLRSSLFREFVRAIKEKEPRYFVWENVKGALSSNGGRDFAAIIDAFSEAGYSLSWQVLNAKDFGVPQNRERVFVVGTRGDGGREVFFETRADQKSPIEITKDAPDSQRIYEVTGIARTLKGLGGGQGAKTMLIRCPLRFLDRNQKNIEGDYAFTVDASQTAGVTDGTRVRRLTPLEAERLMSWPDDWTKWGINESGKQIELSDTQRYKMCGNGVVSKVVEELFRHAILPRDI